MQDDKITKSVDSLVKDSDVSSDDTGGLSLGNNPTDPSTPQDIQAVADPTNTEAASAAQPSEITPTEPAIEVSAPVVAEPETTTPTPESNPSSSLPTSSGDDSDLDPIKKEALQKLEPLVSELDLQPEEKYRALMMIIQATDNKNLVTEAYKTADKIEDSKVRAQALLSIINEIDYFKSKDTATGQ